MYTTVALIDYRLKDVLQLWWHCT